MPAASSVWSRAGAAFRSFFPFSFLLACGFSPAWGRGSLRGGRQGVRGACPSTPPTTPVHPLCPCGGGRLCRATCTQSSARRRGRSARIFPLRGRYARLLRRSRVAGIASAPRLAGLLGTFPACALSGGEHFPQDGAHSSVRRVSPDGGRFLHGAFPQSANSLLTGSFFIFLPLAGGFSPAWGRGSLRGWRQGVRGACPSTPPTTPVHPLCPCGGGRLCRATCTQSSARRRGRSARIFPLRGRYARLLRRSRVAGIASAPRLAGLLGTFPACALSGGEHFPLDGAHSSVRRVSPDGGAFFSSLFRWLAASGRQGKFSPLTYGVKGIVDNR